MTTVNPCVAGSKPAAGEKRPFRKEEVFFILNRDGKEKGFEAERTPPVADRQQEAAGSERSRPERSEHEVCDWKAKPAAGPIDFPAGVQK